MFDLVRRRDRGEAPALCFFEMMFQGRLQRLRACALTIFGSAFTSCPCVQEILQLRRFAVVRNLPIMKRGLFMLSRAAAKAFMWGNLTDERVASVYSRSEFSVSNADARVRQRFSRMAELFGADVHEEVVLTLGILTVQGPEWNPAWARPILRSRRRTVEQHVAKRWIRPVNPHRIHSFHVEYMRSS